MSLKLKAQRDEFYQVRKYKALEVSGQSQFLLNDNNWLKTG
jgi:hypothetical protein